MSDPQGKDILGQQLETILSEESRLPLLVKPRDEQRHQHRMTWTSSGNILDQALQATLLTADDAAGINRSLKRYDAFCPQTRQALGRVMNMLFVARAATCGQVDRDQRTFNGLNRAQLLERFGHLLLPPKRRSRGRRQGRMERRRSFVG